MHPTQDLTVSATPEVSRRNESARPGDEHTRQRSAPYWLLIVLWIAATAGFTESLAARENTAAGRPEFRTVPQVGYTLKATQGTLSDSEWGSGHTFKWYRVDGDTETLVSGVTGDALTVVQSDLGKRFRVVFVFNGSGDERRSLKSPKTVRKEQRCSARVYRDWCTKMWAWERPIYSGGADSQVIGTYYGYLAIGAGIGVINDRSIEHGGETLNSIGEVGMAKYDDSQDKITLGLTAQRWLPDGTQFNIGGIRFSAHSGKTRVVGQYEWVRPSNLLIQRGQWVTVSARIRDSRLSVRDAEATEGTDQSLDFVVKLSPAASDTVTVDYATSDGTATAGMDYTADSGELTFLPDETTKTISVAITDDTVEDDGETMTLTLSNASGADLNDSTAVGRIRNTEEESSDTLTAEFQRVPESHDGSNTFTFRVLLSQDIASGTKSKLWKALTRTGANLKWILRVNNRLDLFEFTMEPKGDDDVIFSLGPSPTDCTAEDAVCTSDGTPLSSAETDTVPGPADASPTISVTDASATEGAAVAFAVSLSEATSQQVTVQYATSGGTATSGTDFTAASSTLTFAANETAKTVRVATTDDSDEEDDETFTLTLSSPTNATLGDATATGTINDNDEEEDVTPTVSVTDASATEGAAVAFAVSLSEATSQQVTVQYATSGGTATSGTDFTAASNTLTFAANETAKTVSVATTDDSDDEDNETFTLTLSSPTNATLGDATATGTINDNDNEDATQPLTAEFQRVPESHDGSNTFTFRVLLSQDIASGTKSKLWKALSRTGANLKQIRRVNNRLDLFEFTMGPTGDDDVTFSLGPSPTDCTAEDAVCTSDGTALSNALADTVPGPAATPPTVSVTDASATEGAAVAFAVSLSEATSQQVTVQYATSGGTATSGTDFTAASSTLTFAANETAKTVSVATADDSDEEDDETFTLTLSSPTNATLGDATATGTINDNDDEEDVTPTISVTDASATEGAAVAFAVSLSEATSQQVTVQYATSGGTATSGTDFTAASSTLTFAANETAKTVSVATTDDSDDEDNETFTLTLSSPTNATLGDATATGTINDNDEDDATQPLTASFESVPAAHTGDAFTFDLTFSEDVEGLSHKTLRDAAFDVTGGSVKKAKRRTQGSNQDWTITVEPTSATEAVTITLPETTDCDATGAICTEDGRKLSNSQTATVNAASASTGDSSSGDEVVQALFVMKGTTPDEAAAALFGERSLSEDQLDALDLLGNRNGGYDLGDLLRWIDRCRSGEADCGGTSTDSGPVGGAALPAAAGGVGTSGRTGRRAPGPRERRPVRRARRRRSTPGYGLMMLLAATMTWSCADEVVGPAIAEPDPGFLTVELTAPIANRHIGVLLELEGPGVGAVRAPGLELYESSAPGQRQIVVAGSLRSGPLARFEVPDRNQIHLYRVHILQVTGEDYKLRDVGQYQAVISN